MNTLGWGSSAVNSLIHRGQALSQDRIAESQRQLYELGVFNEVQIATQDQPSSETEKTVLVAVEETRRWTLGYGGGVEVQRLGSNNPQGTFKASPRLSLDLHRLDVGGRAQTFTLWGRLSYLDTGVGTSYVIPYLFSRRDLNLRLNGLVDVTRDVLTFTDDQRGASISIEKRFSTATEFRPAIVSAEFKLSTCRIEFLRRRFPSESAGPGGRIRRQLMSATVVTIPWTPPAALTHLPTQGFSIKALARRPISFVSRASMQLTTG